MKGKLNKDIVYRGEILPKDTEVEITDSWSEDIGNFYICKLGDEKLIHFEQDDVDIVYYSPSIDWEQRRYEIAKEVLANYWNDSKVHDTDEAVATSIAIADELIKQLKGE